MANGIMAKAAAFHCPTMMAKAASSGLQAKGCGSKAKAKASVNRFGVASAVDYMALACVHLRTLPTMARPLMNAQVDDPPSAVRSQPCRKRKSEALEEEMADLDDTGSFGDINFDEWMGDDFGKVQDEVMHPFRPGAPVRRPYGHGSSKDLDNPQEDQQAVDTLRSRARAVTTVKGDRCRLKWLMDRCRRRRIRPYPLSAERITLAGALLVKGGYRSGAMYLAAI